MMKYSALMGAAALLFAGCSTQAETMEHEEDHHESSASEHGTEVDQLSRYAVYTFDGGIKTIDLDTGKEVNTIDRDGFLRLNQAGDNRHLLVTAGDEFLVYDSGLIAEAHGDHYHYYEADPALTGVKYSAKKAGHVTVNAGNTVLFGDGDGSVQIIETEHIADADAQVTKYQTADPHHGVAVSLSDGSLFVTEGTTESRSTLRVVKDAQPVVSTDDCPGSHGEATAEPTSGGDVLVMGCTNGPFVLRDGQLHKVPVAEAYARTGNLAGHPESPIVLSDYKVVAEPGDTPERPTRVALIDTRADSLQLVELGSAYWFRSLGRGPAGEALVLTYDGNLNVIDPVTGEVQHRIAAIGTWEEQADWQLPGPILKTHGSWGYVTDPTAKELVVIDLTSFEVTKRIALGDAPLELEVVTGK